MAATTFATPINNISTRMGNAHAAGSGRLSVVPGDGAKFPPLTPPAYYRVTVLHAPVAYQPYVDPAHYAIFKVTQVQGDDLIVSGMLDGTADKAFNIGDVVEVRVTRGTIQDIHAAVNTLEAATAPVASVFGRTGAVVAQAGDYAVGQVTGAAPLLSPAFAGTPTAPTPATADSSTQLATTAFVKNQGYSSGAGAGSVTSVGLSMPVEFAVAGSPVTTAGAFTVTKTTQAANLIYAAPSALGGFPSFRNLTSLDIPASVVLTGTPQAPTPATADSSTTLATTAFVKNQGYSANSGTVTSVGLAAPAEFTVSGSPITAAGTLTLAKVSQSAGMIYAGPATGIPATPTFRGMVSTDIPSSVALTGTPTAPTPATVDSSTAIATTAFVKAQNYITAGGAPVASVFGRTGAVVAASGDYAVGQIAGAAPLASPVFTGNPTAPTVAGADSSTAIATTAFVKAQNYLTSAPVASVFGRIGTVVASTGDYTVTQVTGAAPLASPGFTGVPTAPTAAPGTNNTQIATTAFVLANVGGGAVSSVFGRVGAIVANTGDYTVGQVSGAAPLASPNFTGTPTATTAATADNSTTLATTAFVKAQNYLTSAPVASVFGRTGAVVANVGDYSVGQVTGAAPTASPTFSGIPTGPTATVGTNTNQLATTAFVMANQTTPAVSSVFGRTGAIVQVAGDYGVAQVTGAAPLASPALTGTPTAPTAAPGTNTTQLATTAFVLANVGGGGAVASVFGRTGAVVATTGDYTVTQVSGAAPLASPTFTGTPAAPTPATADSSTTLATTAFVKAQGYLTAAPVASVFGRTGVVAATSGDYSVGQVTGAAPLASPTFTGVPAAPTAAPGTNTTQLATTAFVLANAGSGGGGITNPNPMLKGNVTFQDSSSTNTLSQIDGATGNYFSYRPDTTCVFIGKTAAPNIAYGASGAGNNVFIGYQSGLNFSAGVSNTAIGALSLTRPTTACNSNTAVGYQALAMAVGANTVSNNTALGSGALFALASNTSGNTGLGSQAGAINATGNNNTYVGCNAGAGGGSAGSSNTYVGYNTSDVSSSSYTQSTALGANAKITASNQVVLGTTSETALVIRGVSYTFPTGHSAGMLQDDGAGNLSWLGDPLAGLASPTIAIAANYAMTSVNFGRLHLCSGTGANYTVTLPNPAGASGKLICFVMTSSLTALVTIAPFGAETIDGATARVMWANEVATLFCDGTNWIKIAGKTFPTGCRLFCSTNQSVPHNTFTNVALDTVTTDNTGKMADTTNNRIKIIRRGTYLVLASISWQSFTCTNTQMYVDKNSGGVAYQGLVAFTNSQPSMNVINLDPGCVAGDLFSYRLIQLSGATVGIYGGPVGSYLSVTEIPSW